jgi:hypothetical protein
MSSSSGSKNVYEHIDVTKKEHRDRLPVSLRLSNFNRSETNVCNFRDGTVLGEHTSVILPNTMKDADRIRLSIFLDADVEFKPSSMVEAPKFVEKHLKTTNQQLNRKWSLTKNELWILPSQVNNMTIPFKKRPWALSAWFRKVCNTIWPTFVLIAESYKGDQRVEMAISCKFEIRSKEQSNKSKVARGMSLSVPQRRRTPGTALRSKKLDQIQSDIIRQRENIQTNESLYNENEMKLQFIFSLLNSKNGNSLPKQICNDFIKQMSKWKK